MLYTTTLEHMEPDELRDYVHKCMEENDDLAAIKNVQSEIIDLFGRLVTTMLFRKNVFESYAAIKKDLPEFERELNKKYEAFFHEPVFCTEEVNHDK